MKSLLTPCCALILSLSMFSLSSTQAQTTPETVTAQTTVETPAVTSLPVIEPRAFEILRRADAIYKKARSFSIEVQMRLVSPEFKQDDKFNFNIQAVPRQEQLRLIGRDSSGIKAVISDGQKVWRTHSKYKNEYSLQPFRSVEQMRRTTSKFESLLKRGGPEGYALYLFFNDRMASILLEETLQSIRVGETTTLDGVTVESVIVTLSGKSSDKDFTDVITFYFGRDDHLLRRTLFEHSNMDGYAEETYSNTRLNPEFPESLFTFNPTKNMKRVPSVDPMSRDSGVGTVALPIPTPQSAKPLTKQPIAKPQTTKSRSN